MAYTTINKFTEHFKTITYSGNGSNPRTLTGVGFEPSLVWQKNRTDGNGHTLADAIRGGGKTLSSDGTAMQITDKADGHIDAFTSDGFTVGAGSGGDARVNDGSHNYVAFNFKANGAGSSNTDGTITATVSANPSAGFSIIDFTGTEANGSVGHGLGVEPSMFIMRRYTDDGYSSTSAWYIYNKSLGANKYLEFGTAINGTNDGSLWNTTTPATSSVINIGFNANSNHSGQKTIIYAFADIQGYSKAGTYNGGTNTFVYTGFKPKFIIGKEASASNGYHWHLFVPELTGRLEPSNAVAEYTDYPRIVDWNSNGFRWGTSLNNWDNSDGRTYIYYAVGQSMVGTNNVPCTAGSTDG